MPRVALVYPYFRTRAPTEMLFTPLGVASLASQLHALGLEARIFDCTFNTLEQVQASLQDYHPEIIGIYCMITLSRSTFRIAEMVRVEFPDSLLIAGGPLPTLYPEHFSDTFDAVFRGEADLSFPRFCQAFFKLKKHSRQQLSELELGSFAGLYIQKNGLEVSNPPVHHSEKEIGSFPAPFREDFDHAAYQQASLLRDGTRTASLITTYGCPFDCDFCSRPVYGNLFRRRPLSAVLEEVEQVRQLGYDRLWIADDNFTLDLAWVSKFCQALEGRDLTWSCLSRVTGLNPGILNLMKSAGCRRVYLGLESGSQATLRLMNKKASLEEGMHAVHLFREAGIQVAAFFIVGYPGETVASIEATFEFALSLPLDEISFNVPFPLPGSALFQRVSGVDMNRDWDKENEITFVYSSEFDEAWLRHRIDETLQTFSRRK